MRKRRGIFERSPIGKGNNDIYGVLIVDMSSDELEQEDDFRGDLDNLDDVGKYLSQWDYGEYSNEVENLSDINWGDFEVFNNGGDEYLIGTDYRGGDFFLYNISDDVVSLFEKKNTRKAPRTKRTRRLHEGSLGAYVGARMLSDWTASLLVIGAEESEDYDFEQSFTGSFNECLEKLEEYNKILYKNSIDGYLTLEADRTGEFFEGDFDGIYEDLEKLGYV